MITFKLILYECHYYIPLSLEIIKNFQTDVHKQKEDIENIFPFANTELMFSSRVLA